jgi:hypothetical protein
MLKKNSDRLNRITVVFIGTAVSFLCLAIVIQNYQAEKLYLRALEREFPTIEIEKAPYYKETVLLLSRAIALNKSNADYIIKKVDYLAYALKDNVGEALNISPTYIEDLCLQAISLNPINFLYHFELGRFYMQLDRMKEAKNQFFEAIDLNKSQPILKQQLGYYYLKLSKKYFAENKEWQGMKLLMLAATLIKEQAYWEKDFIPAIKGLVGECSSLSYEKGPRNIIYTIFVDKKFYDIYDLNIPYGQTPLLIRAYVKEPVQDVVLYKNGRVFGSFIKRKDNMYEIGVDLFSENNYDTIFRIEPYPQTIIEKVEIVNDL